MSGAFRPAGQKRAGAARRPRSVAIVGWLQALQSLGLLAHGAYQMAVSGWALGGAAPLSRAALRSLIEASTIGAAQVLFALPLLLFGLALFRLKGWAWLMSMTLQGIGLLAALLGYFRAHPNYPAMVMGVVVVLYLNQRLLNPAPAWAINYRGLWGLYARDPIAGENAPAGPVYNRDGSQRRSWYDPLGWAGLDKVPPPDEALAVLDHQRENMRQRRNELNNAISEKSAELAGLGIEAAALEGHPHLQGAHQEHGERIAALARELTDLRRQHSQAGATIEALDLYEARLARGDAGPPRAHIRRAHHPAGETDLRLGRLAEGFAAVSLGLLMIAFVLLIVLARQYLLFGLAAVIGVILFVEAGFRRQLARLISSLTVGLAIVSALVLLYQFFWPIVVLGVLVTGLYLMWENVRELRG